MRNEKAFTLIEVLATIVILGVVMLIAVPSITAVQEASAKRQIKADAEVFIELVRQKIAQDTSIEIPTYKKFLLSDIDTSKLSSTNYDMNSSRVIVGGCGYKGTPEIYKCDSYYVSLKDGREGNGKYTASGDYGKIEMQESTIEEDASTFLSSVEQRFLIKLSEGNIQLSDLVNGLSIELSDINNSELSSYDQDKSIVYVKCNNELSCDVYVSLENENNKCADFQNNFDVNDVLNGIQGGE